MKEWKLKPRLDDKTSFMKLVSLTDADETIVPLCIIIICAVLHQLRGEMA